MASAPPSSQAAAALSLASSLGLSLRADWLEAARAATTAAGGGGGNWSSSASAPMTAEALVSLVLNADLNSAGAGESLPADLEVRIGERTRERGPRERDEKSQRGFDSSRSSLLSARGNRKEKKLTSKDLDKKQQSLHGRPLAGRRILQVDEVVNAAASAKHR